MTSDVYIEEPASIQRYQAASTTLAELPLSPEASARLLSDKIDIEVAILSHPGGWLPQCLKCANTSPLGDAHDPKRNESSQADTNLLENLPADP
ncbi:hypothetical protein NI17_008725 [Thermobifida halotolerans]|uniref:Uncharacterized protein n=1 Tax=Thermobifida halotolerans TaxID=483545 RepID=A0AA97M5M0_9ACTN|nr:hypothetical protein NI17_008725 [Thermobifida halotolerans]